MAVTTGIISLTVTGKEGMPASRAVFDLSKQVVLGGGDTLSDRFATGLSSSEKGAKLLRLRRRVPSDFSPGVDSEKTYAFSLAKEEQTVLVGAIGGNKLDIAEVTGGDGEELLVRRGRGSLEGDRIVLGQPEIISFDPAIRERIKTILLNGELYENQKPSLNDMKLVAGIFALDTENVEELAGLGMPVKVR